VAALVSAVAADPGLISSLTPAQQVRVDAINITNEAEIENYSAYYRLYNKMQSGTTVFLGVVYKY
jgi:hypothetical protein